MPQETTWQADVVGSETDFTNVGNWADEHVAVALDTINSSTSTAPASNRPTTVTDVYHFNITNAVVSTISEFLNGALIGNVTVNKAGATVGSLSAVTGTLLVTAGSFHARGITITDLVTVAAAGTLSPIGMAQANGGVQLAGTLNLAAGTLNSASPILVTAATAVVNWAGGDILGGFNAGAYSVSHLSAITGTPTLVCDVAGTLNLGTPDPVANANGIVVTIASNTTIGSNFACGGMVKTSGVITGGGKTISVGEGGLTGSGCTLNAAGSLTFSLTASGNVTWASNVAAPILNIASGVTATETATGYWGGLTGSGTWAVNSQLIYIQYPATNNFWTFTGSMTRTTGGVKIVFNTDRSNAAAINLGAATPVTVQSYSGGGSLTATLTLNGGLTCGPLVVTSTDIQGNWTSLTMGAGANLTCTTLTLGATTNRSGKVVLGSGTHSISGAVAAAGSGNANAMTFGGKAVLGGNYNGDNIATTFSASAVVLASTNIAVSHTASKVVTNGGADLLGNGAAKTLTITNVDATGGAALRLWNAVDGGGNTNCQICPGPPELLEAA